MHGYVPRTHNKLGDRSFSAAGPRLWNDLPPGLRRSGLTFDSFRQSFENSFIWRPKRLRRTSDYAGMHDADLALVRVASPGVG